MKTKTKMRVLLQMRSSLDLRLLRGEIPWSLAGTSGDRYRANRERRDALVARIETVADAGLDFVTTEAGRQKLVLFVGGEVWKW